jgi:hypothetical protein
MRTLILNNSDIVEGTNNSVLQYQFKGGNINLVKGQKVALASIQMYNSTFNITSANNNNSFSYKWVDGIDYSVAIPNGYYDIPALNNYLHFVMVQNKHYLVSSTGDFVYFITLGINPSRYAVEVNCFGLNTTVATANSWTLPVGASWVIPTVQLIVPSLIVPSTNFGLIIGFVAGTYPISSIGGVSPAFTQTPAYTTDQQFLSTITPQVSVVSSFIFTCSLVNNNYAVPNNLLYSFAPQGTIGEQFIITPNQYVFIDVNPAQYNTFQVSFIDQNFRPVAFQDPNMIIQLVISDIEDNLGL